MWRPHRPPRPRPAALSWVVVTSTREPLMLVAGVDSSTQSTKVLLCQADDGTIVGEATAPHPDGTECDPELWRQALAQAGDGLLDQADARGDASGTGYFSPATGRWLPEMAEAALGKPTRLPRLADPAEIVAGTAAGAALSAGTGDNMGAALGLGLRLGEVVVSIGTSGTAY